MITGWNRPERTCAAPCMRSGWNSFHIIWQSGLQIQKRSSEVWQVLGAVKTEFGKFEEVLSSARNRIRQLDDDLDKLVGVRTRGINRKLREIEQLDSEEAEKLLSVSGE